MTCKSDMIEAKESFLSNITFYKAYRILLKILFDFEMMRSLHENCLLIGQSRNIEPIRMGVRYIDCC